MSHHQSWSGIRSSLLSRTTTTRVRAADPLVLEMRARFVRRFGTTPRVAIPSRHEPRPAGTVRQCVRADITVVRVFVPASCGRRSKHTRARMTSALPPIATNSPGATRSSSTRAATEPCTSRLATGPASPHRCSSGCTVRVEGKRPDGHGGDGRRVPRHCARTRFARVDVGCHSRQLGPGRGVLQRALGQTLDAVNARSRPHLARRILRRRVLLAVARHQLRRLFRKVLPARPV